MGRLGYYRGFSREEGPLKISAMCLAAVVSISFSGVRAAELATDEQKTLYAVGVAVSQSMSSLALSEAELEIVKAGISDGVLQRPLQVDMQSYGPKIQQFAQ